MTPQEELRYLSLLLLEASKWQVSEGDSRTPLELEIDSRIQRLTGVEEVVIDGRLQASVASDGEDVVPSNVTSDAPSDSRQHKLDIQKAWYHKHKADGLVRVVRNGKAEWHPVDECEKEYFLGKKWRWRWTGDNKP